LVIEATDIEVGSSDIATVKAIIYTYPDGIEYEVASTEFENGGFKLNLPAFVPKEYTWFISEGLAKGIIVSDTQAKTGLISAIEAYNSAGEFVGLFVLKNDEWFVGYWYTDRNFTQKGTAEYGVKFDCSLKKGWNVVYSHNEKTTTKKPANELFKWYYMPSY